MAKPVRKEFVKNEPTLVAKNVVTGKVAKHWRDKRDFFYYSTYVPTDPGDTTPTQEEMKLVMERMFQDHPEEEKIDSPEAIDVYIMAGLENGDLTEKGLLVISL